MIDSNQGPVASRIMMTPVSMAEMINPTVATITLVDA